MKIEGMPTILYKYRMWKEPCSEHQYQRRVLTENEVFLASPKQFNDPFDCSLPFRYKEEELNPGNIYLKLREIAKRNWPNLSNEQIEEKCFIKQSSGVFDSADCWKDFYPYFVENVANEYGILSLSTKCDDLLMWSHYADSHNGFCVGLDTQLLFDTIGGALAEVIYSDKFPELGMFDEPLVNTLRLLNTKSMHWSYENEFRLRKSNSARTIHRIPDACIKEIILGCKMSREIKTEIHTIHDEKFSQAKIYEAEINLNEFKLNLNPILKFKIPSA